MKSLKRALCVCLTLAMLLSMLPLSVYAATDMKLTADTVSAKMTVGSQIRVNVTMSNNPGLTTGKVDVGFEKEKFKLVGIENKLQTITENYNGEENFPVTSGAYTLAWDNPTRIDNFTGNGIIATLVFEVLDAATVGDSVVQLSGADFANATANEVAAVCENGKVTLWAELGGYVGFDLEKPRKGGAPQVSVSGTNYTGAVTWTPDVTDGKFAAGTAYTAHVTLTAADNYKFPAGATATCEGGTVHNPVVSSSEDGKSVLTFDVAFPATDDKTLAGLSVTYTGGEKKHGDTIAQSELTVKATYDDKSKDDNFKGYTIGYVNGDTLKKGDTKFTVRCGNVSVEQTITAVKGLPLTADAFTFTAPDLTYDGTDKLNAIKCAVSKEGVGTVTYTVKQNGSKAEEARNAGAYTLYASASEGTVYETGDDIELGTVTIQPKSISGATITLGTQATYSGGEQDVVIESVKDGETSLTKDKDYTIESGGKATEVGNNTLVVRGTGNYTGRATETWSLLAKEVTITPDSNKSKTYGADDPGLTYTTSIDGETTLKESFNSAANGALLYTGTDVGEYAIKLGTLSAGNNFRLTLSSATVYFTITAKNVSELNVTAPDQNTVFGNGNFVEPVVKGVKNETLEGTLQYSITDTADGAAVVSNGSYDAATGSLAKLQKDKTVAVSYTFTPSSGNYTGTKTDSFNVTAKDIAFTVSGDDATVANTLTVKESPVYGDNWSSIVQKKPDVVITAMVGDQKDSDQSHFTLTATGMPNAGDQSYTLIYNGELNGTTYTDVTVVTDTVTVAPKTLTAADLTYSGSTTKVYDGSTAAPAGLTVSVRPASLVGSDFLTISGMAVYNSENVSEAKTIIFTPNAITSGNYALADTAKLTITGVGITPKPVTIDGAAVQSSKTYDGTTNANIDNTNCTVNGAVEGDTVCVDAEHASASYADENVGTGKAVKFSGFSLTGADAGNYELTAQPTTTANITAKTISITSVQVADKTYDGEPTATVKNVEYGGVVSGDQVYANITASFADKDAGASKVVNCNVTSWAGRDAGNYVFDNVLPSVTATIDQARLVGAPSFTKVTKSDTKLSAVTYDLSGVKGVNGEDVTFNFSWGDAAETTVEANKSYAWTITTTNTNYESPLTGSVVLYPVSTRYSDRVRKQAEEFEAEKRGELPDTDSETDSVTVDSFGDVRKSDYFYSAVEWAVESQITQGVSGSSFAPSSECSRAQTMTFLWRAMGEPQPQTLDTDVTDVMTSSYYFTPVLWAMEMGITTGAGDRRFAPNASVTRGQLVTFLYRLAGESGDAVNPFTDVPAGSYYEQAIAWAYANDITTGTGGTTFSPDAPCTRAQIVTFLYRYFNR